MTIENHRSVPGLHVYAGSQGVWQARMYRLPWRTGKPWRGGGEETGMVLRALLGDATVNLLALDVTARSGGYAARGHSDPPTSCSPA